MECGLERGEDFAAHVAAAVATRPVIEQAKGVLLAHRPQSPDQAFAMLVYASQVHNVKVSVLAEAVVALASGHPGRVCVELREVIYTEWPWVTDGSGSGSFGD